jgi:hypothetical protein
MPQLLGTNKNGCIIFNLLPSKTAAMHPIHSPLFPPSSASSWIESTTEASEKPEKPQNRSEDVEGGKKK